MKNQGTMEQNLLETPRNSGRDAADTKLQIPIPTTRLDRWSRRMVFRVLSRLTRGQIVLEESGETWQFGSSEYQGLVVHIVVSDPAAYRTVAFGGSTGGAEAYMARQWSCSDLVALVRIMVANMKVLDSMDSGQSLWRNLGSRLFHILQRNSREGSRRNVSAHYDLSNRFFATFLDPEMMYSAAIFRHPDQSLDDAAVNKLEHVCQRLQLATSDHLLEIGTGWGGMAIHAARNHGCRVTTTTLSREQYEHACARVREAGLDDRITVLLKDYRDLDGEFDKLVSIEMIEAVGHQYYQEYFSRCASLLKPDGLMLLQAITISDQRYEQALRSVDFIQRYIFPGGCLPSNSVMAMHIARDTDMQIIGLEDITSDYALTLEHWRHRFLARARDIAEQGFSEEFLRMWDFYLAYCQGGFMERVIHTAQILIARPEFRLQPLQCRDGSAST